MQTDLLSEKDLIRIYELMKEAFPKAERRTEDGFRRCLKSPYLQIIVKRDDDNKIVAFLKVWEFEEFRFVEHFAVDSACRGRGLGGKMLDHYMAQSSLPVVLEVEPPDGETEIRRIGFYERLGFYLNQYDYNQPPLREGGETIPLKIMSYREPLNEQAFQEIKNTLYNKAYSII